VSPTLERRDRLSIAILSATLGLIAFLGYLGFQLATVSPMGVPASMTTPAAASSVSASPFSIAFPEMLVVVTHTPVATPEPTPEPTPTYTMLPTPRPVAVCMTSTPQGEVCTMPKPPLPTNTPVLECPVEPGEICLSTGGPVHWLTPTPTPESSTTSGLNS